MHPRYRGPVIDAHCHYDASTLLRAPATIAAAGLAAAVHLWDVTWPPNPFPELVEPPSTAPGTLVQCYVPDLSEVGGRDFANDVVGQARRADQLGAAGFKVWKNLGLLLTDVDGRRLAIDDPRLDPLWDVAGELRAPIVMHVSDPPAFFAPLDETNPRYEELVAHPEWWWGGGDYPSLEELHTQFENVVSRHPATIFIAPHYGCFMDFQDVARMLGEYPNYHIDTAAAIADMGRDPSSSVRDTICAHPGKVIFGTDLIRTGDFDMPAQEDRWSLEQFFELHWAFFETAEVTAHPLPAQGDWTVTGLDLPDAVLAQLYFDNAARLFKLPPHTAGN